MRLARTASPLPRKSGWQESNLRSPAPEAGGVADSPTARRSTPGGTRTRSFRVEGPASSPFRPRGQESSGGRARTCALAINSRASYRLDHAGTKEAEAAGLEPANGSHRLRGSNALLYQLGHASTQRKERESNPQGPEAHPFSRRDTAPVAVLPRVAPAGVEPATLRLRGGSSAS
jgi:hypothetical protein